MDNIIYNIFDFKISDKEIKKRKKKILNFFHADNRTVGAS